MVEPQALSTTMVRSRSEGVLLEVKTGDKAYLVFGCGVPLPWWFGMWADTPASSWLT